MSDAIVAHTAKVGFRTNLISILKKICCCFYFSQSTKPQKIDLGPPIPGKKTLVLDLDETLVHSSFYPVCNYDFIAKFKVGENRYSSYVLKRPGIEYFLEFVKEKFEVVIFTASVKEYADSVLDVIAPWIPPSRRFYRQHCTISNGLFIKDLSLFNRPLSSIVIVDNSEFSFSLHRSNAILISTWIGEKKDKQLDTVVGPLLSKLIDAEDVRTVLAKHKLE
ncbi:NLI interacting factor-like phosphatase family protein [Tritrichomonas foetus]|uniref:NLI interacting factor-like phosphatase family protein n=1 Tax=Tritrichomonas foetus TaxID=1144522 RepID=A0A1J4J3I1_9EUKA|nr:NLI interacting factor-like phosphatase family protein [Tritrichomonas foetus]|eukprot:OHS93914.1 NLI interacting factor-like phosphatase family protein [Tritrichomonas foetus]